MKNIRGMTKLLLLSQVLIKEAEKNQWEVSIYERTFQNKIINHKFIYINYKFNLKCNIV